MIEKTEIARLDAMPIEDVAERLGIQVVRHKGICPFHDDTHPSLTFNTLINRYRCYVCDAHGGVIDLVRQVRGCGFVEACEWLGGCSLVPPTRSITIHPKRKVREIKPDVEWLRSLVRPGILNDAAKQFLYSERHIAPEVVMWCRLSSISCAAPCWRYGKAFYDSPSILIPYYDIEGRLMSVQGRYLGTEDRPRFRFPRGSRCHIYNLQILKHLSPGEELWITEGCSDCWAMMSTGRKAIAIPSATLLKEEDLEPLRGINVHMFPDQDLPGEALFLALKERIPQLVRHQLPSGCKDFGEWYKQHSKKR